MASNIELLAPVGSMEALRAAVQNGADSVYLGGKLFSARQYAPNFSDEELKEGVDYAHLYGVKVYVAVNTLLDNSEFEELLNYLSFLWQSQVDAIIVQDLGVAWTVKKLFPQMEIHGSTQMTVHNSPGARLLEQMGFSRVVLAREVSLKNIKTIGERTAIALETFVHGALCVSYSGQCLMSSMIGGRSGNRGRCAQPCRLNYTLVDVAGKEIEEGHLLSPRDLNMIAHLEQLAEAGVCALKVEGRMKRAEYVATVIRNYRQALDRLNEKGKVSELSQKELAQIFNRDFTTGYYFERPGRNLMSYHRPNNRGIRLGRVTAFNPSTREVSVKLDEPLKVGDGYEIWVKKGGRAAGEIRELKQNGKQVLQAETGEVVFKINEGRPQPGDRVFKTMDIDLIRKARESYENPYGLRKIPLYLDVVISAGSPVRITARDDLNNRVEATGDYLVQKAEKHAITEETVQRQLGRMGNTAFYLAELSLRGDAGLMVPVSELNSLRRRIVEAMEDIRLKPFARTEISLESYREKSREVLDILHGRSNNPGRKQGDDIKICVSVGDLESLRGALKAGAKVIYFGGMSLRSKKGIKADQYEQVVQECSEKKAQAVMVIPRIIQENELEKVAESCRRGMEAGVQGFLVQNPGGLQLAKDLDLKGLVGDYTLNIFNDLTIHFLSQWGVERVALSPELTLEQIGQMNFFGQMPGECIVHGVLPLMITEHCAVGNILGKGHLEAGCPMPCLKGKYGLKDRMNLVFPLEPDENCRMHVYNTKTLSMIDKLPGLINLGVEYLRIEGVKESAPWVEKVVNIYCQEIKRIREMGELYQPNDASRELLAKLSPGGFTTGHYYRGVQ